MTLRSFCALIAVIVAFAVFSGSDARAGEACTDACSGNFGPDPCGAFGLGCPPGGGQCIICRNANDCQPGGMCVNQQCIGLPCSRTDAGPGADAAPIDQGVPFPPLDSGAGDAPIEMDSGGPSGDATPGGDALPGADATPGADASPGGDAARRDGTSGGAAVSDPRGSGCSCRSISSGKQAPAALLLFVLLLRRRRSSDLG